MSIAIFRRLALALPEAAESSHMGAADFRLNSRIFATLAYQAKELGTLKFTPEQQASCLSESPDYFTPAPGGWGRMGMTLVRLDAPEVVLAGALRMAYRNLAEKQMKSHLTLRTPSRSASPSAPKAAGLQPKRKSRASTARLQ